MSRWVAEGLDPEAFWRQTPRTFVAAMEGRNAAAEAAHADRMVLAWHIEALARSKKLPSLKKLIGRKPDPGKRQKPKHMLAAMRAWVGATAHLKQE